MPAFSFGSRPPLASTADICLRSLACAGGEREVDADEESYFDKEDSGACLPWLLWHPWLIYGFRMYA